MCSEGAYQFPVWKAGELVPAGVYARIDDESYHIVVLAHEGYLPASFDGHVALYRAVTWRAGRAALPTEQALNRR